MRYITLQSLTLPIRMPRFQPGCSATPLARDRLRLYYFLVRLLRYESPPRIGHLR